MINQKRIILFLCVFVILISFLSIFKTQETLVSNTNTVSSTIDSVIDDISGDFDDNASITPTSKTSVPKSGGTTAPQTN